MPLQRFGFIAQNTFFFENIGKEPVANQLQSVVLFCIQPLEVRVVLCINLFFASFAILKDQN